MNTSKMNKILVIMFIGLLAVQTASSQNLVMETEYSGGKVRNCTINEWKNGVLTKKIEMEHLDGKYPQTTISTFDTVTCGGRIDTIEYRTCYLLMTESIDKEMHQKSYHDNGSLAMIRYFNWEDGQWKENGYHKYDPAGNSLEEESYGKYHYVYFYDSLGRHIGKDEQTFLSNGKSRKGDYVDYSDDGRHAVLIYHVWDIEDSTWKDLKQTLYKLDAQGRILSREDSLLAGDEYKYLDLGKIFYRYDRKGNLKSIRSDGNDRIIYKYRHGLQTQMKHKLPKALISLTVTRTRYDWRHKVPLEEIDIVRTIDGKRRNVTRTWVYEY